MKTEEIIDNIIRMNKEIREKFRSDIDPIPPHMILHEFCTIKISFGRRAGYSRYLVSKFNYATDLLVIPNCRFRQMFKHLGMDIDKANTVVASRVPKDRTLREKPTNIWIDPACLVKKEDMDNIYKLVVSKFPLNQTVIMLSV
jgi:hypothetical protein